MSNEECGKGVSWCSSVPVIKFKFSTRRILMEDRIHSIPAKTMDRCIRHALSLSLLLCLYVPLLTYGMSYCGFNTVCVVFNFLDK